MQSKYRIYDRAGNLVEESENFPRMLRDGERLVVPTMMRDAMDPSLKRALDAARPKLPGHMFDSADNHATKMRAYDQSKLHLSNAWRGGVHLGDYVNYGGQQMIVDCNNEGQPVLVDASKVDGEKAKQDAYDEHKRTLTDAWKKKKEKREEKSEDPEDKEWAMAGPLSDGQSGQAVRDQAWRDSVTNLENAWRK